MQDWHTPYSQVGGAFWRFSLALYGRPGVAEALIALQDRAARDVNLILFAVWVGAVRQHRLHPEELAEAAIAIGSVGEIAAELRGLRRRLRLAREADTQHLRRRILQLELAAEQQGQDRLARLVPFPEAGEGDPLAAAEANLALYLGAEAGSAEANTLRAALAALMRAA